MANLYFKLLLGFCCILIVSGDIFDKLSYFEVIDSQHVSERFRRSLYDGSHHENEDQEYIKEVILKAYNRTFHLQLKPRTELFSDKFKLTVIHADGSEDNVPFQEDNSYAGKVKGYKDSDAHGYFEDGNFVGTVSLDHQIYNIEPAWRHLHDKEHRAGSGKMLVYRGKDIKWPGQEKNIKKFCKSARAEDDVDTSANQKEPKITSANQKGPEMPASRKKRATSNTDKNTCDIIAVADYKFFRTIGQSDIYKTARYIVGVIERVDAIYRKTNWSEPELYYGMGVEIGQIKIHDSFTDTVSLHYNQDKSDWDAVNLLQVFGRDLTIKDFCLGHLFTHQAFQDNILGLAYIASKRSGSAGGICSPTRVIGGFETCFNTAWTSTANTNGDTVLILQSDLVTAHEIGHNWGSEHDPDTSQCAPSSLTDNGKYLMNAFSVSGLDSNNDLFSPCSKLTISGVLAAKSQTCFSAATPVTECGNGLLNAGEDCDAGFLGKYGQDVCCNSRCKLRPTATCSPYNHECCLDCKVAPVATVCRNTTSSSCKKIGYCSGSSFACPAEVDADDNTPCVDNGLCRGGKCLGFCEQRNLLACVCEEVATSCLRCCRNTTNSQCVQTDPETRLPDGRPCVQGYCVLGKCKKAATSLVERFFKFIESITIDKIVQFFKDNLVGVIMIFSLIFWIPISCCVSYKDRQREKRFRNEFDVEPRTDRMFIFDEDKRKVKIPDQHKKPRTPKEIFMAGTKKKY